MACSGPKRLTRRPLPPYRYRPGRTPHPRRHPLGHSHGRPEPEVGAFSPESWWRCETYRYGIDLFAAGYWWESHEVFEALWNAVGRSTSEGRLLKALILVAAAELKREGGRTDAAQRLRRRALRALDGLAPVVLGVDVRVLGRALRDAEATAPRTLRIPLAARPPRRR